jgi:hypothetical protein
MRTNGFSWNQKGQLLVYSYQKYNFNSFVEKPERKQLHTLEEIQIITHHISNRTGVNFYDALGGRSKDQKNEKAEGELDGKGNEII